MRIGNACRFFVFLVVFFVFFCSEFVQAGDQIDLKNAVIVCAQRGRSIEQTVDFLVDEIEKRTGIRLGVSDTKPRDNKPAIVIGAIDKVSMRFDVPEDISIPQTADAYAIWTESVPNKGPAIYLAGHDLRGTLFGAGRFIRLAKMGKGKLSIESPVKILEILLNRPRLFETLQDTVVVEDFNVPAMRRIAEVLFENLRLGADNPVQELINSADSVEMGTLVAELMETGQKKGNFEDRLKGALETVERFKVGSRKNRITDITDHERYLKEFTQSTLKQNPRNLGMI